MIYREKTTEWGGMGEFILRTQIMQLFKCLWYNFHISHYPTKWTLWSRFPVLSVHTLTHIYTRHQSMWISICTTITQWYIKYGVSDVSASKWITSYLKWNSNPHCCPTRTGILTVSLPMLPGYVHAAHQGYVHAAYPWWGQCIALHYGYVIGYVNCYTNLNTTHLQSILNNCTVINQLK